MLFLDDAPSERKTGTCLPSRPETGGNTLGFAKLQAVRVDPAGLWT